MDPLFFKAEDGIATITLNRPEVYNSVDEALATAFRRRLDDCRKNQEIRVVCITGNGRAFCAGQDIQELTGPGAPEVGALISERYNPIVKSIREIEKPVVAAVNGVAAGAGANIALACDIVIASESASFIQSFSNIGLVPDSGGTYFLPRLVGLQRATALMMLGEKVPAKEAAAIGMIYKAISDNDFAKEVQQLLGKLAKMPTKSLGFIKKVISHSLVNDLTKQLAVEEEFQITASKTDDYKEGINAFLEKRKAVFKGV